MTKPDLRIIRARSVRAYATEGKTGLAWAAKLHGAYIIRERKRAAKKWEVVYVGHSRSSLYNTIIHHFSEWNDKQSRIGRTTYVDHLKYRDYLVTVLITPTDQAMPWEAVLIDRLKPRDNDKPMTENLPPADHLPSYEAKWLGLEARPVSEIVDDLGPLMESPF